jgi:hypothetical protein
MALKLNNCFFKIKIGIKRLFLAGLLLTMASSVFSQESDGPKPEKIKDYKSDSSYKDFSDLRFKVAKAQINLLKNNGALLVRLKTNANTINRLKAAGNIDLATQIERETLLTNKIIIGSYLQEFTFCPVYFFYSQFSDSVKNKKLAGVFVDSNLVINPSIVCNASFYLIAESGQVNNSSLGIVSIEQAPVAIERGTPSRTAPIIIKNRFFIQLHKPFPYFQLKGINDPPVKISNYGINFDLLALNTQVKKIMVDKNEVKQLKNLKACVRGLNNRFYDFYQKNKGYVIASEFEKYVY